MKLSKFKERRLIFLLGTLSATGPLALDFYLPALPEMTRSFHSSASMLQLSITTCLFGLGLGQLIIGPLSDRYCRKKPMLIGILLFGLMALLVVFTRNIWVLLGLRFIQGLAGAAGQVLARAVAQDLYHGKELTKFFGLLMSVNGLFPIIAPIIGSATLVITDWVGIFIILALLGGLLGLWIFFDLPETLPQQKRSDPTKRSHLLAGFKALMGNKRFLTIALIQGLIYGTLFSYIAGSTFVFQDYFHLNSQLFALIYALNGLGIVLGSVLASKLATTWNNQRILKIALVGGFIFSLVMISSLWLPSNIWLLILPLLITISTVGMVNTVATSMAMDGQNIHAGSASAILGVLMNLIGGIISPLVGAFGTGTYAPMVLVMFICELIALFMSFRLKKEA